MKGQGLLRKEGPPNIGYFVAKLSIIAIPLSESFRRAFVEPAFGELLESPLSESFRRAFREPSSSLLSESLWRAFEELSESFLCVFKSFDNHKCPVFPKS